MSREDRFMEFSASNVVVSIGFAYFIFGGGLVAYSICTKLMGRWWHH